MCVGVHMKKYLNRIIEKKIQDKLASCGALLIKGPKWCGKSTTALKFANSVIYMQTNKNKTQNIELARTEPDVFLAKKPPLLIDEWQEIPFIWDEIRTEVDKRGEFGQFILTGSSTPLMQREKAQIMHSGVGRITTLIMRPMSLYESLDSTGGVSLNELFLGKKIKTHESKLTFQDYCYLICRGGWPQSVGVSKELALEISKDYFEQLIQSDLLKDKSLFRDRHKLTKTLKSYARNISSQCSIKTLMDDIKENDNLSISNITILSYLELFKENFIIEDIEAWNPNLRSKTAIRTAPTRHFICPSIAARALELGPGSLLNDLKTFGLLFEDLAVRDLKIYAEKINGKVYHYRDKNGLECDAVVYLDNGEFGLIEVKIGNSVRIEEGAKNLLKLKSLLSPKMKEPSFLMIITTSDTAYVRGDGVIVCPLGCLKD